MSAATVVRRLSTLAGVGILGACLAIGPAYAASPNGQTVTMTENVHGVFAEPEATNPCTGDTFNGGTGIQFTGNLVNHVTYFTGSDEVWATFTETGAISGKIGRAHV